MLDFSTVECNLSKDFDFNKRACPTEEELELGIVKFKSNLEGLTTRIDMNAIDERDAIFNEVIKKLQNPVSLFVSPTNHPPHTYIMEWGHTISYILAWTFLPQFVTSVLQKFYYAFQYMRAAPPVPGSATFIRDRNRIYLLVICLYFAYVTYSIIGGLPSNYYDEIGLKPWEINEKLRVTFKKPSLRYHPDRMVNANEAEVARAAETFMRVQKVYETLDDPVLRQAYERFGPIDDQECTNCITYRDYLFNGITQVVIYYGALFILNIILNFTSSNIYG